MFDLDLSCFLLASYLATMASYALGLVAHEFGHAGMDGALFGRKRGSGLPKEARFLGAAQPKSNLLEHRAQKCMRFCA